MKFPMEMTRTIKGFGYFDPSTVEEAVSVLSELGNSVEILAGGTDLLNQMRLRQVVPEYILNIKNISSLEYIKEDNGLRIGALTRISDIRESESIKNGYMSLFDAAEWFGTPQIRNMATIGGNVCRSSPSSDMIAPLMALDAELKLMGPAGERQVTIEDFLVGAGENALSSEVLTEVIVPCHEGPWGAAFMKLKRSSADLAKASCAVRLKVNGGKCEDIRVVLGAVADRVFRAREAENAIKGEKINDAVIEKAAESAGQATRPITDIRSSAEYRKETIKILVKRMIQLSIERAKNN